MEKTGTVEYKLVVRQDDVSGEYGFCLEHLTEIFDMPSVARDSYLIAHDIIEHVNGIEEIGGIGEELQAMGGIWNTRGQWSDIRRDNPYNGSDSYKNIASDISELGRRFLLGGESIGCEVPEIDTSEFEQELKEIWIQAKESLRYEFEYEPLEASEYIEYKTAFESLFVLGIEKHRKQYGERYTANTLFYEIVNALTGLIESEPTQDEYIKLTVNYDELTAEAVAGNIYDDMYWNEETEEYEEY